MSGPTWTTLLANVQGRLRDANARTWTTAQLLRIANAAQRYVAMRGWDMDKPLFLRSAEIRSETDREVYDLPRDLGRLEWFERGDLGTSYRPHIPIIEAVDAQRNRYGVIFAQWYDSHPQDARKTVESIYLVGNDRFGVVPTPTVSTRIFRCYYLLLPPEMKGTNDTCALPIQFQNVFELEACIRAKREAQEDYSYFADELALEWQLARRSCDRMADVDLIVPPARII